MDELSRWADLRARWPLGWKLSPSFVLIDVVVPAAYTAWVGPRLPGE